MRLVSAISALVFVMLLAGCGSDRGGCRPELAFYHWKSTWESGPSTQAFLDSLGSTKIYLRLFDVDLDEGTGRPVPVGLFEGFESDSVPENVVPVVFITNRTLRNFTEGKALELAKNITDLVRNYLPSPKALQLDCDWTESTRETFFRLVDNVRAQLPETTLSATIRLHQFKYPDRTGVPPVERGMLMVYNMGEVDNWDTKNSIIDPSIAAQYLNQAKSYPLPLDIALPLFHWGCVYRDGRLVQLFNNLGKVELADTTRFERIEENRFLTKKNTYLNGFFLNKGDRIRLEAVHLTALKAVVEMLRPFADCCHSTVAFYHLDSMILEKYSPDQLQEVVDRLCE